MMIRRADLTDFLAVDGESVALVGGRVLRLGPVATVILQLLDDGPSTVEVIGGELASAFGAPPDGDVAEAVERQLTDLQEAGLIVYDKR